MNASRNGLPAVGGVVPFSSLDWPGKLAAVIFIAGCPWRCHYCHNPHLQQRQTVQSWPTICEFLSKRQGLLDAVVFSGGEPLSESQLPRMLEDVRAMGFQAALHTAGIYPERFRQVLPMLDWVGLDIKTSTSRYDALTGVRCSAVAANTSLALLLASGMSFECRTTWHPDWLPETELLELAQHLASLGVQNYAVQNFRSTPGTEGCRPLSEAAQQHLCGRFANFSYR